MMLLQIDTVMTTTELPSLITAGSMAVAIIEWLKSTKFVPFMSRETATINRIVAWIVAAGSATGIHAVLQDGTLTVTGLHLMTVATAIWVTIKSYAFQWLIYKNVIKAPQTVAVAAATGQAPAQNP